MSRPSATQEAAKLTGDAAPFDGTVPEESGRPAAAEPERAPRQISAELAALHAIEQVARSFSSERNLDAVLRKVLHAALLLVNASAGSLLLFDATSNQLRFEVVEGRGQDLLEGKRMSVDQGIAGWVFSHGQPLVVPDAGTDERFNSDFDRSLGFHTTSLIALPLAFAGKRIGVLEVLNKASGEPFLESDASVLSVLAAQSAIAIESARLYQSLRAERSRILAVEEEVRRELARDVHDGPAQLLSALVMNVRFAKTLLDEDRTETAKQELLGIEELATRALRQMRELLFNQRPLVLETQGLIPALEAYVARLGETQELNVKLEMSAGDVRLPGSADRTVFAIVLEAMRNVRKHAPSAQVTLRVAQSDRELQIDIADDGPGFNPEQVRATYAQRGSLGLLTMSERAQQIGGTLSIDSASGKGTTVRLRVPLTADVNALAPT